MNVKRTAGVKQIEITPDKFGGYFYLEGSTLWRRESDGVDLPAELIIPKVKIQSNFTFTMASNGDPSTFDFVMDAFPDYTKFDGTKKVLAMLQVVESDDDASAGEDLARRSHCNTKEEAAGITPSAAEGEFDHWKTYGEQNHFATDVDHDGVYTPDSNYPDVNDPETYYDLTFVNTTGVAHTGVFKVDNVVVDSAQATKTVQIVVTPAIVSENLVATWLGSDTPITISTVDDKEVFTMPKGSVTVTLSAGT